MSFNNVSERHYLSRNKSQKWYLIIILNTINIIQFDTYFNFLQTTMLVVCFAYNKNHKGDNIVGNKIQRTLTIYTKLRDHHYVNVPLLAETFHVHPRSIQRDLEDIRDFLNDQHQHLLYDHHTQNYYMSHQTMTDDQVTPTSVTYEMTHQLYQQLQHHYQTYVLKNDAHKMLVTFQMAPSEAIHFCFTYRHALRLVSPDTLFAQFTTELIQLQMIYMKGAL